MSYKYAKLAKKRQVGQLSQYEVIVAPVISEKATTLTQFNQYTFRVAVSANKFQIRQAIEGIFGVKVKAVNTINCDGKTRRFRGVLGKTNAYKKAIVTLSEGSIDVMAGR
jgi:large subunit ribosomal protein L23